MIRKSNKTSLKGILFSLVLFFSFCQIIHAQEQHILLENEKDILNYMDTVYGADDLLINGRIYVPQHGLAFGHPYFETSDWIPGSVFIKGQNYHTVKLKYDLELDEFVLFIVDNRENKNYIVLNRHFVDSVHLGKYRFVNASILKQTKLGPGYVEMVYDKDIYFFINHSKNFKNAFSESKPYGEYADMKSVNYIIREDRLTKLPTKKSFLDYFENNKKEIQKYLKKNRIKYKKANSGELYRLLTYINENLN
jgi:hypothetical protein